MKASCATNSCHRRGRQQNQAAATCCYDVSSCLCLYLAGSIAEASTQLHMDTNSPVSWVFKSDSTSASLGLTSQPVHASPASLNRSPHWTAHAQSPSTPQTYTSPLSPRQSVVQQLGSPYGPASASPQGHSVLGRSNSAARSQDLLLPMMPSTEDSKLHATVSGLRFALQEAQLQLGHSQHQVKLQTQANICCPCACTAVMAAHSGCCRVTYSAESQTFPAYLLWT